LIVGFIIVVYVLIYPLKMIYFYAFRANDIWTNKK
jgi:hypothetical protein